MQLHRLPKNAGPGGGPPGLIFQSLQPPARLRGKIHTQMAFFLDKTTCSILKIWYQLSWYLQPQFAQPRRLRLLLYLVKIPLSSTILEATSLALNLPIHRFTFDCKLSSSPFAMLVCMCLVFGRNKILGKKHWVTKLFFF